MRNPLNDLMTRCNAVIADSGPQDRIDNLIAEVRGGYGHEMYLTGEDDLLDDATVDGVRAIRGWLGRRLTDTCFAQSQASVHNSVNAQASAMASATAEATLSATMAQVWQMPDELLTADQKQELGQLLKELDDAGDESKLKKAGRAVCDWVFDRCIEAAPKVMPFVAQAVQNGLGL